MARKTHTSTAVKRRYNDKTYTTISTAIPKELAEQFKEKCRQLDIPQRQVILKAVESFVKEEI